MLRVSVANVTSEQDGQQQCKIISGPVGIYARQKVRRAGRRKEWGEGVLEVLWGVFNF